MENQETKAVTEVKTPELPELVKMYNDIEELELKASKEGENLPDELYLQKEALKHLLSGKIDLAVEFHNTLESYVAAIQERLVTAKTALERVHDAITAAAKIAPDKKAQGSVHAIRMQANSQASVVVEDEALVPEQFKVVDLKIERRFPVTDTASRRYWASIILRKPIKTEEEYAALPEADQVELRKCMTVSASKSAIAAHYKETKEVIPGTKIERGEHLRFGAAKPLTTPKASKKKELATPEGVQLQ